MLSRLALATLLGITASTAAADIAATRVLTDFSAGSSDLGWYVVNDGVMGGRSEGGFVVADDGLDFSGTTNTDGGGFSSIRTRGLELDLTGFGGIRVRVRGDGRRYTWRLTTDARWRGRQVSYWADFETRKGEWTVADIPFESFTPRWRGRTLPGPALDPGAIRGMGLMIYDAKDGPFALRLDSVQAYRAAAPFSLAELQWKKRVLVAYAPAADDAHLADLLRDVAATRSEFEERDMQLVVVLDTPGSRAGSRELGDDEVRGVRRDARIEPGAFALRLIGKDGGIKRSAAEPTALKDLYAVIDAMPMRRAEIRRRGEAQR